MARSSFKLPTTREINPQQQDALDLPLEGQHLIIGGPGTGKSVVALLRARRLANAKKDYLFLVYNVLLEKNCYGLGGGELQAVTWKRWFKNMFSKWFGRAMPTDAGGNEDWEAIAAMKPLEDIDALPYLVIDEGQDMPPQFYQTLVKVGFENFYVVADQNQRITDRHSSRREIEATLDIETENTLKLTANYRNSHPIARLAHVFCTDDPAVKPVELPKSKIKDKVPWMVRYDDNGERKFAHIAAQILRAYDRNTDKLICIITPNDNVRERVCKSLISTVLPRQLDHGMPAIQTYSATERTVDDSLLGKIAEEKCARCGAQMIIRQNRQDGGIFWGCTKYSSSDSGCTHTRDYVRIDFRNGGIAVINLQSIKGLEFDTVFIADIDAYWGKDKDELMKKFYVMVSRARDDIILLRTGAISQEVEEIMPNDKTILERR